MRYVPPQRVSFLRRFGLKTGLDFVNFGLESGIVFEETTGVCRSRLLDVLSFQFPTNKKLKEKYANSKCILFFGLK